MSNFKLAMYCFSIFLLMLAQLLSPQTASANAGVPMLLLMAVPMQVSLLLIIPIEAIIARKVLAISWEKAALLSTLTNIVSTIIGIPITWALLVVIEFAINFCLYKLNILDSIFSCGGNETISAVVACLFTFPWLGPGVDRFVWMVPFAAIVLCLPFFYVSYISEAWTGRLLFKSIPFSSLKEWSWQANRTTYFLILLFLLYELCMSLINPSYLSPVLRYHGKFWL